MTTAHTGPENPHTDLTTHSHLGQWTDRILGVLDEHIDDAELDRRLIGRTTRASKIHTAVLWGGVHQITCRGKGKHLTIAEPITISPTDSINDLRAALAPLPITPDELCTRCFRSAYGPITIRLTHAARTGIAHRFRSNVFTEHTATTAAPKPDEHGFHDIQLSYHARCAVAGLLAPNGDGPGQAWHDGIVTTAWDEIAQAFPRTLARAGRRSATALARAFPYEWFAQWAALHPHNMDEEKCVNCYDPDAGL
ncbi:hypothetical protein [Nocardia sp. NRRL S-836]|uniref:hypothetical protein n=1 Tax=Nocardia sp. NRRL S-836 TaxID=1519492 RepID=UPI0006AE24C5|nr:hypothetical protein [Nocardia sp. NRRL S-836]KOV84777.1 hypothetical protein ADL03_16060 [Nocardia sp. NRRL S-836]